jgi:hypothetical protein
VARRDGSDPLRPGRRSSRLGRAKPPGVHRRTVPCAIRHDPPINSQKAARPSRSSRADDAASCVEKLSPIDLLILLGRRPPFALGKPAVEKQSCEWQVNVPLPRSPYWTLMQRRAYSPSVSSDVPPGVVSQQRRTVSLRVYEMIDGHGLYRLSAMHFSEYQDCFSGHSQVCLFSGLTV